MNTPPRNDAAPRGGGAGVSNRTSCDKSIGDSRYWRAWERRFAPRPERPEDQRGSLARLRRQAALAGPLEGVGPMTRLTLAWMRGDRVRALSIARAIDDELGWVGVELPGEPGEGGR